MSTEKIDRNAADMAQAADLAQAAGAALAAVRAEHPLVHCITNYVTVNDCANALLAAGASPVMADDIAEVADIVGISGALVVNIGTLNARTVRSMKAAARAAKRRGTPSVLDPVGAGASALRTKTAAALAAKGGFAVIRGNASEIGTLAGGYGKTRGVDSTAVVSADGIAEGAVDNAISLARQTGSVVAVTGKTDVITDGSAVYAVENGHALMPRMTGSGCVLSAITGAFVAVARAAGIERATAVTAAIAFVGLAGELAAGDAERLTRDGDASTGTATFRTAFIDRLASLSPEALAKGAKIERLA